MLKQSFLGIAVALAPLSSSAFAVDVVTVTRDWETGAGDYLQVPPTVPRDGCVWNNTVFSNGAIIERRQQPWAFFRCMQGSWQSFDTFDAARIGREPAPPGPA